MSPNTTVFVIAAVVVIVAVVEPDADDRSADDNEDDVGDREAAANEDGGDGAADDLLPPTLVARRASIGAVDLRLFAAAAAAAEGDRGDVGDAVVLASVDDSKSSGGGRCGPVSRAMRRVRRRAARIAVSIAHWRRSRTRYSCGERKGERREGRSQMCERKMGRERIMGTIGR